MWQDLLKTLRVNFPIRILEKLALGVSSEAFCLDLFCPTTSLSLATLLYLTETCGGMNASREFIVAIDGAREEFPLENIEAVRFPASLQSRGGTFQAILVLY